MVKVRRNTDGTGKVRVAGVVSFRKGDGVGSGAQMK